MAEGNGTQGGRGRAARVSRETGETKVEVRLDLDGRATGRPDDAAPIRAKTGIGFFDHMLHALAFHAGWGLELVCDRATSRLTTTTPSRTPGWRWARRWPTRWATGRASRVSAIATPPWTKPLARAVVDVSARPFYAGELKLSAGARRRALLRDGAALLPFPSPTPPPSPCTST